MKQWKKSSFCEASGCVEVANDSTDGGLVGIRSSLEPSKQIFFTQEEWKAFKEGVLNGEF